jgi:hypothetical protein
MTNTETWLPVTGYPGYEVSDRGRVRSLDRQVRSRWGTPKTLKGKMLAQARVGGSGDTGRYYACVVYRDGKRKQVTVHTLMLETFVSPRPEGMNGCHRDDDPVNNRLDNLYWGTQRQNVLDAVKSARHISVAKAAKTHCPHGHEYTEDNTYVRSDGHRECRACHRAQVNRAYRRNKPLVGAPNSTRTHCPQGHPYDEVNTYRPPGSNSRFCRACLRNRNRERQRRKRMTSK